MTYVVIGCGVALALVFGTSWQAKVGARRYRDFATSAGPLDVLPRPLRSAAAWLVVVVEGVLAVALLVVVVTTFGGVVVFAGTALLLLAFTLAIGVSLRRGDRRPCQCFGAGVTPLGRGQVIRNLVLLVFAFAGLVGSADQAGGARDVAPAGALIASVAGLVAGLLITRFEDLVDLFSSPGVSDGLRRVPR
ncbi:hypothetical protein OG394_02650 [Kribbella sp. NBC_01245]|uniref:MauE/DoxX family redox-associated membrane protein n=1 Tax=Kribbella sp. NBC_01245 TaxID=2903578 RepID=UPI002E288793|nr:MauE/DoxX family redox-associated membrane protein [Kribbella sp. NBC_01245]